MEQLQKNLLAVRARIIKACESCHRDPATVGLLTITKNHGAERIRQLYELGLRQFGENYAQEITAKAADLQDLDIKWVFVGVLQTNKIRKIVRTAGEIQSVACLKHAQAIARCAQEFRKPEYPIYISINAADEAGKGGASRHDVEALATQILHELPSLRLKGLMAIPPADSAAGCRPGDAPALYKELALMARGIGEGLLSLGMSGDLEAAICAGSNCVRVGTDILGQRIF